MEKIRVTCEMEVTLKVIGGKCKPLILESLKTESENDDVLRYYKKYFSTRMEAVRGGSVAIESVSRSER